MEKSETAVYHYDANPPLQFALDVVPPVPRQAAVALPEARQPVPQGLRHQGLA